ncbi:MAG TPA: PAS domain S-box protein [Syntrophales bacterium]|nr:PAS domain S-box protein [Syntrophales bacterium]
MKFSLFRSIRTQLLLIVLLAALPALVIVIYSGVTRLQSDTETAQTDAMRVLQSLAYDYEHSVESTRQFLMTLAKLPDVRNQNGAACNKLFRELLKENPVYTTVLAADAEGMVFANALSFSPYSVKQRKYFQDSLRTKKFSVGEYMIGMASGQPTLPFALPVLDSKGRIKTVVITGINLARYGQMFTKTNLPEGSEFGIFDHKNILLYKSHEAEKSLGTTDWPDMIRYMSTQPEEGIYTAVGVDGIKRLYTYKRFYLKDSVSPYLFMRVGIPEAQALSRARNTLFINLALMCAAFIMAMVLAWFPGKVIIIHRLNKLADAAHRLGNGDLSARTGLDHSKDELGQLTEAIDEMAGVLERKESDRRQSEEALKRSEEKYRELVENANSIILRRNRAGHIIFFNEFAQKFFGYREDEILGKNVIGTIVPEVESTGRDLKAMIENIGLNPERYVNNVNENITSRGERVWIAWTNKPIRDEKGQVTEILCVGNDITERKRAEEQLRESEIRCRLITEAITDYIYTVRIEDGKVVETKHGAGCMAVTGYMEEEFTADPYLWYRMVAVEDRRVVEDHARKVSAGEDVPSIEHRIIRKDGIERWVRNTPVPHRDEHGKLLSYDGLIQDITEHKRDEEEKKKLMSQLIQAQKMEAIGTLAGGIAHDFNNILGALIGYTELAIKDSEEEKRRHHLAQVLRVCDRAKNLVKQILSFSRQKEHELKPIDIGIIVKEAIKLLRSSLPTTIEIRQRIATGPTMVLADPTWIHQILMNLCTNAAHAMREKGGLLTIRLVNEKISLDSVFISPLLQPGPYALLTISDTGHGIDLSIMDRIFDPFFTTKDEGEGTGLGLAVVYGIVNNLGGTITVQSEPGKGSVFNVYLPLLETGIPIDTYTISQNLPTGTERLLLVDDEESLMEIVKEMLQHLSYDVVAVSSSPEALKIFLDEPDRFDMVITDMTMPKMTGVELAKKLMEVRPNMPIILCTGFSDRISEGEAKKLGIREYLMKPISMEDMALVVRGLLDDIRKQC